MRGSSRASSTAAPKASPDKSPQPSYSPVFSKTLRDAHRPTDCDLQAAGEGVKQLTRSLVVWRTSQHGIQQPQDSRYFKTQEQSLNLVVPHRLSLPNYRRKVLVGDGETNQAHLISTAQQYVVLIETMKWMPDHVICRYIDPTRCLAEIVNRLKGVSSRYLRKIFRDLVPRCRDVVEQFVLTLAPGARFEITLRIHRESKGSLLRKDVQISFVSQLSPARVAGVQLV